MEKRARKKNLGGFPALGVIFSTTLALFVLGLFGVLVLYTSRLGEKIRSEVKIQVYLNSTITETQRLQLENNLLSQPWVYKGNGGGLQYISADQAAKKFIADTGEDFTELLGENPLHAAYMVAIDPAGYSAQQLESIKASILKMKGVFDVVYQGTLIESINKNTTIISLVLGGNVILLFLAVVFLINNSLRLALFSQRFLIRSMQLVGAKSSFILKPFLSRAFIYGLISAMLASLLLWVAITMVQNWIEDLSALYDQQYFLIILGVLGVTGVLISGISTYFSVRRYLGMSLDDLY